MSHHVTSVVTCNLSTSTLSTEQPLNNMSTRGRSASPRSRDVDVDMERQSDAKPDAKFIVITNLTRNVVDTHLQSIFAFYGEVVKIDLPTYVKCVYCILGSNPVLFFLNTFTFPCSGSKQRESILGICGRGLRSNGRVSHERRPTRRRRAQSRDLRHAPPNALALSPLPPSKRARP